MSQLSITSEGISLPAIAADTGGYLGAPLVLDNEGYVHAPSSCYVITDGDVEAGYVNIPDGVTTMVLDKDFSSSFSLHFTTVNVMRPMVQFVISDIAFSDGANVQIVMPEGTSLVTSSLISLEGGLYVSEPNAVYTFYIGNQPVEEGEPTWIYVAPVLSQVNSQITVTSEGISLPAIAADTGGYVGAPLVLDNEGYVHAPSPCYVITEEDVYGGYVNIPDGVTTMVLDKDLYSNFSLHFTTVDVMRPMVQLVISDITFHGGSNIQVVMPEGTSLFTSSPISLESGLFLWEPNTVHTFYMGNQPLEAGEPTWIYVAPAISQANTPTYIVTQDDWNSGNLTLALEYTSITIPSWLTGMPPSNVFEIALQPSSYFTPGKQRITLFGNALLPVSYSGLTVAIMAAPGDTVNGLGDEDAVAISDLTKTTTCYPRSDEDASGFWVDNV